MMMMIPVHGWYTSLSLLLLRLGVAEGPERLLVFGAQPLQLLHRVRSAPNGSAELGPQLHDFAGLRLCLLCVPITIAFLWPPRHCEDRSDSNTAATPARENSAITQFIKNHKLSVGQICAHMV